MENSDKLLNIENLSVDFKSSDIHVEAVKNISLSIGKSEVMGLVGESGSGKSVTSLAIMRLLESPPAQVTSGRILFQDQNLLDLSPEDMRHLRGNDISMIFQEPMTSLNPVYTIGNQLSEPMRFHQKLSKKQAWAEAIDWLGRVGLKTPEKKILCYPHELSGGQKQRVMIAMAMCCHPKLLIADEPTTALDVTIQKQVLNLMLELQREFQTSLLLITHDLNIVSDIADKISVMYRGEVVEKGCARQILDKPEHSYTIGLMRCRPKRVGNPSRLPTLMESGEPHDEVKKSRIEEKTERAKQFPDAPLLEIIDLKTYFPVRSGFFSSIQSWVKAVDGVSFGIKKGSSFGLVGESGCGKTTLGRTLMRLVPAHAGTILFEGRDVLSFGRSDLFDFRRRVQIIFQDPFSSLGPRMTVEEIVMEPMIIHGSIIGRANRRERVVQLLTKVGLKEEHLARFPHEFSGGQRQRISIARALALKPDFLICDESVSALDVSIQAQILNLLLDLQLEFGLTYLFIGHDLGVVRFFSDEMAVMNQGKIIEQGSAEDIYLRPQHPYTQKLLSSIPGDLQTGASTATKEPKRS